VTKQAWTVLAVAMAVSFVVLLMTHDGLALGALIMFVVSIWHVGDAA